jgi:tRNA-Thr(GGU) m(6)t(6)A37 methyltransferase TsaA
MLNVVPIGFVSSTLTDRVLAPKQAFEGAPSAWLVFDSAYADGLVDLKLGDEILVITWLDRASRDVLRVHPRDDLKAPQKGVFSTRSADRPNPIGLHQVTILEIVALRVCVSHLEALDGTPILDIKPVLAEQREG